MSKRDIRLFVNDILESIEKIQKWTQDLSYETFSKDAKTQDAIVRNLEIIGEAAKNIPDDLPSAVCRNSLEAGGGIPQYRNP